MADRYHEGYADGKLMQSVADKAEIERLRLQIINYQLEGRDGTLAEKCERLERELAVHKADAMRAIESENTDAATIDALRRELDRVTELGTHMASEFNRVQRELAEARAVIDKVEEIAVNNRTGCGTCTTVVNLVVSYAADQPGVTNGY